MVFLVVWASAASGCHDRTAGSWDPDRLGLSIGQLWQRPDPALRAWVANTLASRVVAGEVELLGDRVTALGLTDGFWTAGGKPAAVVVRNSGPQPSRQKLQLECHAEEADLPITALLDDGQTRHRRVFHRPGRIVVSLDAVPPGQQRLWLVSTDRGWVPGNRDPRQLGVRVTVPPPTEVLELADGPRRRALLRQLAERPFFGKTRLLGDLLVAFGLTRDRWTSDETPAGLIVTNPGPGVLNTGLTLSCHAPAHGLPLRATVTCDGTSRTVRFDQPGDRRLALPPLPAGARRVCRVETDRSWTHGPGGVPRGVRLSLDLGRELRALALAPNRLRRSHLAHAVADGKAAGLQVLHLDGERLVAAGLSLDRWTVGGTPAALVLTNRRDRPLRPRLTLGCDAPPDQLPIRAILRHDHGRWSAVRFDQPGQQTVALPPVPPHQRRLVLLYTDRTWRPNRGGDSRRLGVRIARIYSGF